ncbi:MAG TPA: c-type cytochrome [Pseudomonadales bacterium]|nr:c-type cytochrome [Pseudomonadales bacterium]
MNLMSSQSTRRVLKALGAGVLASVALSSAALPPGTDAEILERIKPIGQLQAAEPVVVAEGPREPRTGEQVYDSYCQACHAIGVSGAPKFADGDAWAPRIAKGMDVLYASTFNGLNVMPPRGTCPDCTDDELRASVDYMVDAAQ